MIDEIEMVAIASHVALRVAFIRIAEQS